MSDSPENTPVPPSAPLKGDAAKVSVMHLLGLLNLLGWPIGALAQLLMWCLADKDDALMAVHGRAALNFSLSLFIYTMVGVVLTLITGGLFMFVLLPALLLFAIFMIIGALKGAAAAKEGLPYTYPLSLKLI